MEQYLECARIASTHGIRGAVKLENRCDSPEVLADLPFMYLKNKDGSMRKLTVEHTAVQKSMVIAAFREIGTIEEAAAFKWTILYADRDDVPLEEGAHFIADLLGLPVIDERAGRVGILKDVQSPAGQDIYEVERPDGTTFLFPAVPAFVKKVETEGDGAGIYVALIDGFLDDSAEEVRPQ